MRAGKVPKTVIAAAFKDLKGVIKWGRNVGGITLS